MYWFIKYRPFDEVQFFKVNQTCQAYHVLEQTVPVTNVAPQAAQ